MSPLSLASATQLTQPPASLEIFDPYSQQLIVCTKPRGAAMSSELVPVSAGHAASGASWALRLLQLAMLSSVAVLIWFMLELLQTTS